MSSSTGKDSNFTEGIEGHSNDFLLNRLTAAKIQRSMQGTIEQHENFEIETEENIPIAKKVRVKMIM